MKKQRYLLILSAALFINFALIAQESGSGLDSVFISKPKKNKLLYGFSDPVLSSVTIKNWSIKRSAVSSGEVLGNIGRSALAIFAGSSWTFGSSKDVYWNLRGELICNNENFSWGINLYCPGVLEKNKQRVTNDDGSYSVDTEKMAFLNWHEEAPGIVLEHGDTIAKYIIIMDLRTSPLLSQWNEAPYRQQSPRFKAHTERVFGMTFSSNTKVDFGVAGNLRGKGFALLYNGELWQTWLFYEDRLRMIFDSDIDDLPNVKKNERLPPALKCNKPYSVLEKYDLMRLAMLSKYISNTVDQDTHEL